MLSAVAANETFSELVRNSLARDRHEDQWLAGDN